MAAYSLFALLNGSSSVGLLPADTAVMVVLLHENTPLVAPVAERMRVCALNLVTSVHHGFTSLFAMSDCSSSFTNLSMPFARRLTSLANIFSSIVNGDFILFAF